MNIKPNKIILFFILAGLSWGSLAQAQSTRVSRFLLLKAGSDFKKVVSTLKDRGVHIQNQFPPRIITGSALKSGDFQSVPGVQKIYASLIPVTDVQELGPMAMAAVLQWNRNLTTEAKAIGGASVQSFQAKAAALSMPNPDNIQLSVEGETLKITWDPVYGAHLYEIHKSQFSGFKTPLQKSYAAVNWLDLPLTPKDSNQTLYVRVRALDRRKQETGLWSQAGSVGVPSLSISEVLAAPEIVSPLPNYDAEGFNVILEWKQSGGHQSRVQISESSSFSNALIDSVVTDFEYGVPSGFLILDGTYYARVKVWGPQSSPWSEVRKFHISPPRTVGADTFINPELPQ